MASFTSSIPSFKAALKARLEAIPALATGATAVTRGNPHPSHWPREVVIIGPAVAEPWAFVAGMSQANEAYAVELTVNVTGPSRDAHATTEERAYALADVVRSSLIAWNLTGAAICSGAWGEVSVVTPGAARDQEGLDERDRDATVTVTVNVTARLLGYG